MKRTLRFLSLSVMLLSASFIMAQKSMLITGVVVDKGGTPLPGVSVYEKGTTNGTMTDLNGKYALNGISKNDTIAISYVGFVAQTRMVGNDAVINFILEEDVLALEEVQVVAFQTQKKESIIASINTLNPKDLKVAPTNLTTALAGQIAGVISYQRSGEPGKDNAEFFIRGVTSFGYKSSPLILIDGLEVTTDDLARVEPDNIASFSIMKDATATSLYGARGANGVILVTTKTGKKGKPTLNARVEMQTAMPTMTNQFLGGVQYMDLYNRAQLTRDPNAILYYSKDKIEGTRQGLNNQVYPNVDWYRALFRPSVENYKANLDISGGGEVAQYFLSVSYNNEKGLLQVDKMNNFNNNININRFNMRANVDINATKTTKIAVKINSVIDRYNGPMIEASDIFKSVMQANPVNFPQFFDPNYAGWGGAFANTKHTLFGNKGNGGFPNPYADMVKGYRDQFSSTTMAQTTLEQDLSMITKGLKLRGMASLTSYSKNENSRSINPYFYGIAERSTEAGVIHSLYQITEGTDFLGNPNIVNHANSSFYFEVIGQYDRSFGPHSVGGLVVFYAKEALNTLKTTTALATLPSRNMGLSGRATYGFDSRYHVELNFGYNGSEKFAVNNRFGFFPSAGLGWSISNEHFYSNELKRVVSSLKLKGTYGLVGNDAISEPEDRFFYMSDVNLNHGDRGFAFGTEYNNWYNGYNITRYPNPSVTWEVAKKANLGLEMGLFDKFNLQVDLFSEQRDNIYMPWDFIPSTMGLTAGIKSNLGKAESYGLDASADYKVSFNKDFWLTARGNFTYATNKVLENGEPSYKFPYQSRIGQSINQEWGLVAERLFIDDYEAMNSPSQYGQPVGSSGYMAGDIKYVDANRDGKIDDDDMVPIGYPTIPEIVYGFGASTGYKGVDFSFFFQGSARSSFFVEPNKIAPFVGERNALQVIANDYWSENDPDPYAFWPRLSVTSMPNNEKRSTWWMYDGSFLRLKSVELGYSFPERLLAKIHVSRLRLYLQGTNLLCFSPFKLWDPEMGAEGLGYPPQRLFNIGVNINF